MSKQLYFTLLQKIFLFGTFFMIGECLYHFSGLRLQDTTNFWPAAAVVFGRFFMWLWASASLLIAGVLWFVYRHASSVQSLVIGLGLFSFFHAGLLWSFSRLPLTTLWADTPAVFVWFSGYTVQLKIEALILVAFGLFVVYGWKKGFLSINK